MTKEQSKERAAIAEAHALINGPTGRELLDKVRDLQAQGVRGGQFDRTMGNVINVLSGAGLYLAAVSPPDAD